MSRLKNKNCLITGAASGIGRYLAIGLAKEGINMFITDINMERLEEVKKEIEPLGVKVFADRCDVSNYEEFVKISSAFYSKFDALDMLINNAGISGGGFIEDYTLEDWKQILDINLWSVIYSLKVFLPKMLERGSGHIVNTASGAGIVGLPNHLHYVASKFAVVGITEGLFSELNDRGIDVSVICPTHVKTNIIDNSEIYIPPRLLEAEDQQDREKKLAEFKEKFWEEYMRHSQTPEQVAKKYIKGIKKKRLYIFDKSTLPLAMFIKAISRGLYKRVLRREGRRNSKIIEKILDEIGIEEK